VRGDPFNGRGRFSDDRAAKENEKLDFVAAKPESIGEFRTPSLRDVARSAPYMHDGRFARLRDVVIFYSMLPDLPAVGHREETLKRLRLSGAEVADLVAFLESLTGEDLPAYLKSQPSSLASPESFTFSFWAAVAAPPWTKRNENEPSNGARTEITPFSPAPRS
jgi:cytochrome c peroxidase